MVVNQVLTAVCIALVFGGAFLWLCKAVFGEEA